MTNDEIRKQIYSTIDKLALDFVFYDRKFDHLLEVGSIEQAIKDEVITMEDIIETFKQSLKYHMVQK